MRFERRKQQDQQAVDLSGSLDKEKVLLSELRGHAGRLRSGSTTWGRDEKGRTSDGEWGGGQGVSMSRLSILARILKDARKQRKGNWKAHQ